MTYARRRAISFAAAVREALKEKQQIVRHTTPKKADHPLLTAIDNARMSLAGVPYHNPNKSDDDILYG